MRVQMQGEAAEKFVLENQKIALRLGRSFGEFLSLFIVFYAIGKKIWSVTREKRQDGEAEQQLWGAGEGRQESYPGLASGSSLRPLPSPDPGDVGLRRQLRGWGGRWCLGVGKKKESGVGGGCPCASVSPVIRGGPYLCRWGPTWAGPSVATAQSLFVCFSPHSLFFSAKIPAHPTAAGSTSFPLS